MPTRVASGTCPSLIPGTPCPWGAGEHWRAHQATPGRVLPHPLCPSGSYLGVPARGQGLVAALALQAELVPVFAQGGHLLGCREHERGVSDCPAPAKAPGEARLRAPWGAALKGGCSLARCANQPRCGDRSAAAHRVLEAIPAMGTWPPQPLTPPALALPSHRHPFPRASPARVVFSFLLPASIFTRHVTQNDPAPIQIFGCYHAHPTRSVMPPPRTPSCSGSPGSLGRSSGAAPRTPTRLQPGGRDSRQPPASPRMDVWPWKTLVSWACGCSPLARSLGAGATCRQVRRHHPCIAPECHEPAEQLAAGTKNGFKASVGKFREGKCFETGCVNAPPPSWPRAVRPQEHPGR